jgi:hypothetical protein
MALSFPSHLMPGRINLKPSRGQELGDAPATFVLSRLNLNLV